MPVFAAFVKLAYQLLKLLFPVKVFQPASRQCQGFCEFEQAANIDGKTGLGHFIGQGHECFGVNNSNSVTRAESKNPPPGIRAGESVFNPG